MVAEFPDVDPGRNQFNAKELESMEFTCERATMASQVNFVQVMLRRLPAVGHILSLTDTQLAHHVSGSTTEDVNIRLWNEWLGRFLMGLISLKTKPARAFHERVKLNLNLMLSGKAILRELQALGDVAVGPEVLLIQARFEAGGYITAGMDADSIYLGALEFLRDFHRLLIPKAGYDEKLRLFLDKLPKTLTRLKSELQRRYGRYVQLEVIEPERPVDLNRLMRWLM